MTQFVLNPKIVRLSREIFISLHEDAVTLCVGFILVALRSGRLMLYFLAFRLQPKLAEAHMAWHSSGWQVASFRRPNPGRRRPYAHGAFLRRAYIPLPKLAASDFLPVPL